MKLYVTATSPYGRIARIVAHEKDLAARVHVIEARTREAGSPYYAVLPSGRVPYLERDDGPGLEDSALIARYLDHSDGKPCLHPTPETASWDYGRLDSTARSLLDGLAVYVREVRRPANEQSPTIVAHEIERARRLCAQWNGLVGHPLMRGELNMAQITLFVALDLCLRRQVHDWRAANPELLAWYQRLATRPSFVATG